LRRNETKRIESTFRSDSRQSTTRETSKPVTIIDEKAQKAEAKAAAKAARARQQAEIEIEIAARTAAASN
jgi:hypothetical protein